MDREGALRFLEFHKANPQVFDALVLLCNRALDRGRDHGSIQLFWEQLRWEEYLREDTDDPFYKLNNNWRPWYARFLEYKGVVPKGFFAKRRGRSEES